MKTTDLLKKTLEHPYFTLAFVIAIWFILPRFGTPAVMIGCAIVLSTYVALWPDRFRSRSGSLMTAFCLVAFMWIATAFVTVLSLAGELK